MSDIDADHTISLARLFGRFLAQGREEPFTNGDCFADQTTRLYFVLMPTLFSFSSCLHRSRCSHYHFIVLVAIVLFRMPYH